MHCFTSNPLPARPFKTQVLLDAKVQTWKEQLTQVSTEATQELALEELLAKVVTKWADVEFAVLGYKELKDVFILGGIEEVQIALEVCTFRQRLCPPVMHLSVVFLS